MKIRELLTDASKWTQKVDARTKKGTPVNYFSAWAVCWCLVGMIYYCYPKNYDSYEVTIKIIQAIGTDNIPGWNDAPERTFAEVKALVDQLDI